MTDGAAMGYKTSAFTRSERHWLIAALIVLLGFALYPNWASFYGLTIIRDGMIFAVFALSLDYLWGKSGTPSFGHATFFGIGAYAMGLAGLHLKTDYASLVGLFTAATSAGLLALAVGYFLIYAGVRGALFLIVTAALTQISFQVATSWSEVTGGDAGLVGVPPLSIPLVGEPYVVIDEIDRYYLAFVVMAMTLFGLWFACRGRYGRTLSAIMSNEFRAKTIGIHTSRHLVIVFTVSAMIAGLAGAIYASMAGFVAPDLIGQILSVEVIVWVFIGGRGTLLGPLIGTFVVLRVSQEVSSFSTTLWPLIIGFFFIAMVFLFPDGVITVARQASGWLGLRRVRAGGGRP